MTFCAEYPINQADNKNGIPGILIGRYPGDVYAGGNPWQLLTAVTAKSFYQGAAAMIQENGFKSSEDKNAWLELLNLEKKNVSTEEIAKAAVSAGDAVMYRLFLHVKDRDGHIDEQISKQSGVQTSAKDLTWSYANILSAMQARKASVGLL
jgi:glucoamylase